MKTKNRVPNFEILRVLAMYFIVVWHFIRHGLLNESVPTCSFTFDGFLNFSIMQTTMTITAMAVNLYVLITGYFMIQSRQKWNKVPHLWLQVFIYSIFILGGVKLLDGNFHIGIKELLHNGLVIRYNAYWFVTKYMALVLLAPYINLAARNLTKRNYKLLLAIMFFMDVTLYKFFYGENYSSGYSLFHFVYLYLIAGYIRIWKPFRCVRAGKIGQLWLFSVFSIFIMETLLESLKFFYHHDTPCFRLTVELIGNNEFTLVSSLLFFMWISKLRFNVDNCIFRGCMKIAPFTFAVYLIHDNNNVRPILWKWVLSHSNIDSGLLYAQLFGYSLGIFIVCLIIDYFLKRFMSCLHVDTFVDALTNQARTRLSRYLE